MDIQRIIYKTGNGYFYLFPLLAVIFAVFGCYLPLQPDNSTKILIDSLSRLYLISSIPFALWYFSKRTKPLPPIEGEQDRAVYYVKQIKLRFVLVGINFPINIFLYFSLHASSYFYAAAIGAVALLFCRVSRAAIMQTLYPANETTETQNDIV